MRLKFTLIICLLAGLLSFENSFSQSRSAKAKAVRYTENVNAPLTDDEMSKLREVYADYLENDVLKNAAKVKRMKHLLRNRVEVRFLPNKSDQKPCKTLSDFPLFNHYNENLQRDVVYDKRTFNILKYDLPFFSHTTEIYRIDNTDYFVYIKSQYN